MPYIERFNGNICVKKGEFRLALKYYSKALFGLKMIFDGDKNAFLESCTDAVKYIAEIEIPCCLNLAHCYLKTEEWHHAIKYAGQVLSNDEDNVKALYRRGVAYTKIGEIDRAREDLEDALGLTENEAEKKAIEQAQRDINALVVRNKQREKEAAQRMFKFSDKKKPTSEDQKA